jgi:metal-responsive CopG/Arc/MetJ family transcriptional regulator
MRQRVFVRVGISLRQEDVDKADRLAKEMGLPRSALIRLALLEYLRRQAEAHKEGT